MFKLKFRSEPKQAKSKVYFCEAFASIPKTSLTQTVITPLYLKLYIRSSSYKHWTVACMKDYPVQTRRIISVNYILTHIY